MSHQADDERCLLSVSFLEGYVREFWLRPDPPSLPHRALGAKLQHPIETPKNASRHAWPGNVISGRDIPSRHVASNPAPLDRLARYWRIHARQSDIDLCPCSPRLP